MRVSFMPTPLELLLIQPAGEMNLEPHPLTDKNQSNSPGGLFYKSKQG